MAKHITKQEQTPDEMTKELATKTVDYWIDPKENTEIKVCEDYENKNQRTYYPFYRNGTPKHENLEKPNLIDMSHTVLRI
jgi:hypothetical protein